VLGRESLCNIRAAGMSELLKVVSKIYTVLYTGVLDKKCTTITVMQGHHVTNIEVYPGVKDMIVLLDGWHLRCVVREDAEFP
jgi:hypothetical protein